MYMNRKYLLTLVTTLALIIHVLLSFPLPGEAGSCVPWPLHTSVSIVSPCGAPVPVGGWRRPPENAVAEP